MIKHIGILALAMLLSTSAYENESLAQGFGGFHGRVRTRGVGYGGIVGYPRYRTGRVGYGYGYGNVGNPYGAVGGVTTVGGMRVGGRNYVAPTAANLALADMALSNRYIPQPRAWRSIMSRRGPKTGGRSLAMPVSGPPGLDAAWWSCLK